MQEKLKEKGAEIQRLKQELQQRDSMEKKTNSPTDNKTDHENESVEVDN